MQSFKNIALCWALLFAAVAVVFMGNEASAFEAEEDNEEVALGEGRADSMDDMNTASENRYIAPLINFQSSMLIASFNFRLFGWIGCRIACNSACAAAGVTGNT